MFTLIHTSLTRKRRAAPPPPAARTLRTRRRAFTLIELTIVILIIAILSMLGLSAINAAYQQSRVQRTQAMIAKIDSLITEKYDSYRTRPVPIRINPSLNLQPWQIAQIRLNAIHELMRLEMPDRQSDVAINPVILPAIPALTQTYRRRVAPTTWYVNTANEGAECLYMILAAMRDGDKSALDFFAPSEIGDTDNDGMNEILDSFGQPIVFLRWAPGYRNDVVPFPVTPQSAADPDPFDPMKIDYRYRDADLTNDPFALKPLVWSAGPDKKHDINVGIFDSGNNPIAYSAMTPPNDPYHQNGNSTFAGSPADTNGDGYPDYTDNITNHDWEAR